MASTRTHQSMGFLKEGGTAASHLPACHVPLIPEKIHKGGSVQSSREFCDQMDLSGKCATTKTKEAIMKMSEKHSNSLNTQSENMPPDSICKGVKVTLDNNSMWNEYFRCRTEMILTKQGCRMFPYCRFRICGLQPHRTYSLIMDIQPLDNNQYMWTGESWQTSRKAECHIKSKPFIHPESPATGQHWMQSPVSFYKLKLTNNVSYQEENIILHPLHRYLPRLHLVEMDKATDVIRLNDPNVLTFSFLQTEFITVTTYQNPQVAQLKVNYNPFAKGLKEGGLNSWGLKLKANIGKDVNKDGSDSVSEQHPVKKSLKVLLANHKPKCSKEGVSRFSIDHQKNSTKNNDPFSGAVPKENPSSSHPAQKLISELIREAHVSLQRCPMEQLDSDQSSSLSAPQSNTKATSLTEGNKLSVGERDSTSPSTPQKQSPTGKRHRKLKDGKRHLNMEPHCCSAAPSEVGQVSSEYSDNQNVSATASDTVKQQKRPARLPLPALALFLKQHSTKYKKTNGKMTSPTQAPPTESPPKSKDAIAAPNLEAIVRNTTECSSADPDQIDLDGTEQAGDAEEQPSSQLSHNSIMASYSVETKTDDPLAFVPEGLGSELKVPDDKPVTANFHDSFSPPTLSTCSTSSPISHSFPHTVLSAPKSPKTAVETSDPLKSEPLLFYPECSFDFGPLSLASSPEPLPSLPACLALDTESSSAAATTNGSIQDPEHSKSTSVLKWHTVLPPPETNVQSSFTFHSPHQVSPLMSVTSPLFPRHLQPPSLNSTPTSPNGSTQSFQETEPHLPFPGELSPLTLQLSLSPTFSSLDENGLSPTPSLSDLVHLFTTDVDIGMGVEFANTESTSAPCPSPTVAEIQEGSSQMQQVPVGKPCKKKKASKLTKLARLDMNQSLDDYRSKQPNLDEVEEQLFISFTSKVKLEKLYFQEALRIHIADSGEDLNSQPRILPEENPTDEEPKLSNDADCVKETIATFQKNLLKDLDLMKYRQVIHPVLQEVGLKMTLLDPALSIDLQYLGVCLPIPPPGTDVEPQSQTLPPTQGGSSSFLSRTGKTTDVTQIKGWREKFTSSMTLPISESGPEAPTGPQLSGSTPQLGVPSSEPQKKNLSAFCSDMLDEYLENEGKLIDERAASFSQLPVETPDYKLPEISSSYVRTLDPIQTKKTTVSPASDLISGFIPPSKRPRLKEIKIDRRTEKKLRCPKRIKSKPALSESSPCVLQQPVVLTPGGLSQPIESLKQPPVDRRRKLKHIPSSHILSHSRSVAVVSDMHRDLAPVESDSELEPTSGPSVNAGKKQSQPTVTRALLRQKELENGVVWEGCDPTSITKERAAIALTSLFTLTGFVSEDPTAPVQLPQKRALPCLNDFCRLGCICSSLSYNSRINHCGRAACMFGCSCLKQKVVLLKNLDSSDSSTPSHHDKVKKRKKKKKKKKRRMKMAYVLKEADTVTQSVKRVHTLWRRNVEDTDPEPTYNPVIALPSSSPAVKSKCRSVHSSCARVQCFREKTLKKKEASKDARLTRQKTLKQQELTSKRTETKTSSSLSSTKKDQQVQGSLFEPTQNPPAKPTPKLSRRLFIMANCKWDCDEDRSLVLKKLCRLMAREQLDKWFWFKKYLISPINKTLVKNGFSSYIQYKVQVSAPSLKKKQDAEPEKKPTKGNQKNVRSSTLQKQNYPSQPTPGDERSPKDRRKEVQKPEYLEDWQIEETQPVEDGQKEVTEETQVIEDWLKEVTEETQVIEDWQKEVTMLTQPVQDRQEEVTEETQLVEDWQKEVIEEEQLVEDWQKEVIEETDVVEAWQKEVKKSEMKEESQCHSKYQDEEGQERSVEMKSDKKQNEGIALPSLKKVSPAGYLSANRKHPGGTDHLIQVNGKLYPLANIHVDRMGASHPDNHQATFLMGHVGSQSQSYVSCKAPNSGPAPITALSASSDPAASTLTVTTTSTPPSVTQHTFTTSPTALQAKNLVFQTSALSVGAGPAKDSPVMLVHVAPSHISQEVPACLPSSQQMVLQPVQTAPSAQCYRQADGKLVQLIAINQLTPIKSKFVVQGGTTSSSSSALSTLCSKTPAATISGKSPTGTTGTLSSSSSSSVSDSSCLYSFNSPSSLSSIPSSNTSSSTSLPSMFVSVAKQGSCTFKLQTSGSSKNSAQVTVPLTQMGEVPDRLPPPQDLTTEVTLPGRAVVQHTPASPQTQPPAESPIPEERPPPPKSPNRKEDLAVNLVDLDIICVDDDMEGFITNPRPVEVVDLVSSSETENSSDTDTETEAEGEKEKTPGCNRHHHNMMEKMRRWQLRSHFSDLQKEVGQSPKMSKVSTLTKAVSLIQKLRRTERTLKRKKGYLKKRIDKFLSILAPSEEQTGPVLEDSDPSHYIKIISSDEEKTTNAEPTQTSFTEAPQEIQVLQRDRSPTQLSPKRHVQIEPSGLENVQLSLTEPELEDRHPAASESAEGGACADPPVASSDQGCVTLAPPSHAMGLSNSGEEKTPVSVQLEPHHIPHIVNTVMALNTITHNAPQVINRNRSIPIILSRVKTASQQVPLNRKDPEGDTQAPAEVPSLPVKALPERPVWHLSPVAVETVYLQAAPPPPIPDTNTPCLTRLEIPDTSLVHQSKSGLHRKTTPLRITSVTGSTHPPNPFHPGPTLHQTQPTVQRTQTLTLRPASSQAPGSLSSNGSNQQPSVLMVPAPEELSAQTSSVLGKVTELRHAPQYQAANIKSVSDTSNWGVKPGPTVEYTTGGVLAPPPLLHMKVGQAKVVDLTSSEGTAVEGGESGVDNGGVTWRPMPRLVPLGLRGNSPS